MFYIIQLTNMPITDLDFDYLEDAIIEENEKSFIGNNTSLENIHETKLRQEIIKQLEEDLGDIAVVSQDKQGNYGVVIKDNKNEYFEERFSRLMTSLDVLQNITLNEFVNDSKELPDSITTDNSLKTVNRLMSFIDSSYNMTEDTYIYDDEQGLITLDRFIRDAEIGQIYYIGGIVEYKKF